MTSSVSSEENFDFEKMYFTETSLSLPQQDVNPWELSQESFPERVKLIEEQGNTSSYLVDTLVKVKGPNDAMRSAAIKHWESEKNRASFWRSLSPLLFVSSGVFCSFLGVVVVGSPLFAAIAVLTSSIAIIVLEIKNEGRIEKANEELLQWNVHPAQPIADARSGAYVSGFFPAMNFDLKGRFDTISPQNVLHPSELTWLYEQDLVRMRNEITIKMERQYISCSDKAKWVEQFVAQNLLSFKAIAYAYEPENLKRLILEPWALSFDAYRQDVLTVQNEFQAKSNEIRNQAKVEINRLEKLRDLALNLPRAEKKARDDEARYKYRKDYTNKWQALENNKAIYSATVAPIKLYYNEWIAGVERWESSYLSQLRLEKDEALSYYFEPAINLFSAAFNSWQNQTKEDVVIYQSRNHPFPDLMPLPTAPPKDW